MCTYKHVTMSGENGKREKGGEGERKRIRGKLSLSSYQLSFVVCMSVCAAVVRSSGVCAAVVRSSGVCAAVVRSSGVCAAVVRSSGLCTTKELAR